MDQKIVDARKKVDDRETDLRYFFDDKRDQTRSKILTAEDVLTDGMERRLADARHRLQLAAGGLDQLSPLRKLGGGYAYVGLEDGSHAKSVSQIVVGQTLSLQFADGSADAKVVDVKQNSVKPDMKHAEPKNR